MSKKQFAVMDGNTYYFIRLNGEEVFYSISAAQNREVVTLNVNDFVTIEYAQPVSVLDHVAPPSIYDAYSLTIDSRADTVIATKPLS